MADNNCSPGNGALAASAGTPRRSSTVRDTLEVYPYETDKLKGHKDLFLIAHSFPHLTAKKITKT